ncbi:MAG: energy-coupling factor ABC transporter permease [Kineosporiaceae bacterium]
MHVPDGYIDAPVSLAAGAIALTGIAISLRGARRELDERAAPMAGLVAAFIFAVQMLNFPVAAGTSGHLLGGTLAAILVGPYTGVLCVSVVLLVQGLVFADGGLTALGVNITNMGLVTVVVGWFVFAALRRLLPRTRAGVVLASGLAAFASVPAAALMFTAFYAVGGTSDIGLGKVLTAMLSYHVLIGIGEALITAATVASVLQTRPDLVHGASHLRRDLVLKAPEAPPASVTVPSALAPAAPADPEVIR